MKSTDESDIIPSYQGKIPDVNTELKIKRNKQL